MLTEIKEKLENCHSPDGTVEDVQEKLSVVQVIRLYIPFILPNIANLWKVL